MAFDMKDRLGQLKHVVSRIMYDRDATTFRTWRTSFNTIKAVL